MWKKKILNIVNAAVIAAVTMTVTVSATAGTAYIPAEGAGCTFSKCLTADDPATGSAAGTIDRDGSFTSEADTKDLVIRNEVTGNQASRNKYFRFTVRLSNVNDTDVYTVSLADDQDADTIDGNADAVSGANSATADANQNKTNLTEVTGTQLKQGVNYYLRHGQSIVIRGIAPSAGYEVTEDAEDYDPAAGGVDGFTDPDRSDAGIADRKDIGTIAGADKAVRISYLNVREGVIPVFPSSAGIGILLSIANLAGFFVIRKEKAHMTGGSVYSRNGCTTVKNPEPEAEHSKEEDGTAGEAAEAPSDTDFFAGIMTLRQLEERYRQLAKLYHPDNGSGAAGVFAKINGQYKARKGSFAEDMTAVKGSPAERTGQGNRRHGKKKHHP